jgi:hypothetical protein
MPTNRESSGQPGAPEIRIDRRPRHSGVEPTCDVVAGGSVCGFLGTVFEFEDDDGGDMCLCPAHEFQLLGGGPRQ